MKRKGDAPNSKDKLLQFAENLKFFEMILKASYIDEFVHIYNATEGVLKIFCISAAPLLSKQIKGFHTVIAQSATFQPLDYFQTLLGLSSLE